MLWRSPRLWPTSWVATYASIRPISESGNGSVRARGSAAPACVQYHASTRLATLWKKPMLAFRISPERGSLTLGPYAFSFVDGSQRIVEKRASSRSKSESLAAGTRAVMALLKPAARNTGSHISTPLISHGTHFAGVAGSMYQTMGLVGSDTAAFGSFAPSRKRLMKQRRGPDTRSSS